MQNFVYKDRLETDTDHLNEINKRRLFYLRAECKNNPEDYKKACAELKEWCDDPRAYAPSIAIAVDDTIRTICECATSVGYDISPCIDVFRVLASHRFDMHPISIQRFEFYMNTILIPYRDRYLSEISTLVRKKVSKKPRKTTKKQDFIKSNESLASFIPKTDNTFSQFIAPLGNPNDQVNQQFSAFVDQLTNNSNQVISNLTGNTITDVNNNNDIINTNNNNNNNNSKVNNSMNTINTNDDITFSSNNVLNFPFGDCLQPNPIVNFNPTYN